MADHFDPYYTWLGVPPEEQPPDYYRLLGVRQYETNRDVINNAADQRMAHIRTFQAGKRSAESQRILNELAAAVVCLLNPEKKAAYDQQLRANQAARAILQLAPAPPSWQQPPPVAPPSPMRPLPVALVSPAAESPAISMGSERVVSVKRTRSSKSSTPLALGGLVAAAVALAAIAVWALNQRETTPPTPTIAKGVAKTSDTPPTDDPKKPPAADIAKLPAKGETSTKGSDSKPSTTTEASQETPSHETTKPGDDSRAEWRYHVAARGIFKRAQAGWVLSRPNQPDEAWEEVSRTEKYVEIKEPKSGRTMRLQQDSYTILTNGRWLGQKAGSWGSGVTSAPSSTTNAETKSPPTTQVATSEIPAPPIDPPDSAPSLRVPVPTDEALDAARQRIKSAFGAEVAKAVKPAEKSALAKQFLEAAKNETSPSVRYAVLGAARKLAVSGGDVALAVSIASDIGQKFETDAVLVVSDTITDLSKGELVVVEQEKLVDAAMKAAHDALENEQAEVADGLTQIAFTFANRAKDPARRKAAKALRDEAVRFKEAFEAFRVAGDLLEVDAGDPKANLAVGKFYCFERRDWIRGREHLAKGSAEKLAAAAKAEVEASDAQGNLAAADAWYDQREAFTGRERTVLEHHAADLYELAAPSLTGLDKAKADKRLTELKTVLVAADKAAVDSGGPQIVSKKGAVKYLEGVMVRAFVTNAGREIATPYVCTVKDYSQLPDTIIKQYVSDEYNRPTTFYAVGYVVLEEDAEIAIRIDSCTCKIGPDAFTAPAGSLQQNTKTLKKGVWPVVVTIKTTTISSRPYFSVTHVVNGKNALHYIEKEWLAESAKMVPLPNGGAVKSQVIEPR